jgi:hypothetical protein
MAASGQLSDEITGRDHYILAQALILGINAIDGTPIERRQSSNRDDMMRLLLAVYPGQADWQIIANGVGVDVPAVDLPEDKQMREAKPKLRLVWERPEPSSE